MRCALVFYFVATIFVIVYSMPELCVIKEWNKGNNYAYCGSRMVNYTFDFIPPISQNISYINLWGQPLKQLPYNAFRNLSSQSSISEISVIFCQISHVDAGALLNLHNLTDIDLSYNDINHIDSKLFSYTKQMVNIFMGYNKIEVLPNGIFQNLLQLKVVYLRYNQIRQVEKYSFINTPSLRRIDLGNNRIEFMDILFKDKVDNLTILWLYSNPWKCDCGLRPLYAFLIKIDLLDQFGLECEKPPALHGKNWIDISRDEFVCKSEEATTAQDSVMTSTELLVTNGVILKLDKEQGINKDAEPVNIEDETSTSFEKPKTESSDKPDTKRKPETRMEISDITQRSLIIDEKQVAAVEEETNSSDGSIKALQEPVDDQIVTTTSEISFNNHEGADTNVPSFFNDLRWLPWTLFAVAIVCLLGCAARYTYTNYRRKTMASVRGTDQLAEEASELMYFQTAQQAKC